MANYIGDGFGNYSLVTAANPAFRGRLKNANKQKNALAELMERLNIALTGQPQPPDETLKMTMTIGPQYYDDGRNSAIVAKNGYKLVLTVGTTSPLKTSANLAKFMNAAATATQDFTSEQRAQIRILNTQNAAFLFPTVSALFTTFRKFLEECGMETATLEAVKQELKTANSQIRYKNSGYDRPAI